MTIRFYDIVYIIDHNHFSGFLKEKHDNRSLLQKKVDRERFKKNKIDMYSEKLNKVIENKLKRFNEQEVYLYLLHKLFDINGLPENKQDMLKIKTFFELYNIIKKIKIENSKEINKDYFYKALAILEKIN